MQKKPKMLTPLERWKDEPLKAVSTEEKAIPPTEEEIKQAKEWIREWVKEDTGEDVVFDDEKES